MSEQLTVRELIELLEAVEDKELKVTSEDSYYQEIPVCGLMVDEDRVLLESGIN